MFNMYLINSGLLNKTLNISEEKIYDLEFDDESSVIFDICDIFEQTGEVKFVVSGFGQNEWPVSCRFDLPGIIEEIPEIINKIRKEEYNFKLNFYEQGVEREIIFEEKGENVSLMCLSRTNWRPIPATIEMNKREIEIIFKRLYDKFILYSTELCGSLINSPLLSEWLNLLRNE